MRILGLDLGERRIGIAITDPLLITAQSLEVIDKKTTDWENRLDELVGSYDITTIVIGLPKNMNGTLGPKGQLSIEVANHLKKRYDFPVILWDERLSTVAVEKMLIASNVRRYKRKKVIDQLAATWILQGYLDAQRRC